MAAFAGGFWLLLRARTFDVILGLTLLSYAVNLFLFVMGRLAIGVPPVISDAAAGYTDPLPQALVLLFALCCGAIVANLYYAQPIIELIAPDVGLSAERASLIVSLTQIGYALGLLFLVPLADLLESRRLMLITTAAGRPCLVITMRSCSRSTRSTISERRFFTSPKGRCWDSVTVPRVAIGIAKETSVVDPDGASLDANR